MTNRLESNNLRKSLKMQRRKGKMKLLIVFRVEKYERDLKRWEFMDDENKRESQRIMSMNDK